MNILLTNDDGIFSEGISELYQVFSQRHTVFVIAPENEQSACSNAITTRTKIKLLILGNGKYSVSGFPADCVNIGINSKLIPEIQLVISGINHGPNVGDDVFFSGTVAGARTAYIFSKSGIAISLDSYHKPSKYLKDAANFLLTFIDDISGVIKKKNILLNINYPDLPKESIKGVFYTHLGKRIYRDSYLKEYISDNEIYVKLDGSIDSIQSNESDVTELKNGYITITPLSTDCTDFSSLKDLKSGQFYV